MSANKAGFGNMPVIIGPPNFSVKVRDRFGSIVYPIESISKNIRLRKVNICCFVPDGEFCPAIGTEMLLTVTAHGKEFRKLAKVEKLVDREKPRKEKPDTRKVFQISTADFSEILN